MNPSIQLLRHEHIHEPKHTIIIDTNTNTYMGPKQTTIDRNTYRHTWTQTDNYRLEYIGIQTWIQAYNYRHEHTRRRESIHTLALLDTDAVR